MNGGSDGRKREWDRGMIRRGRRNKLYCRKQAITSPLVTVTNETAEEHKGRNTYKEVSLMKVQQNRLAIVHSCYFHM